MIAEIQSFLNARGIDSTQPETAYAVLILAGVILCAIVILVLNKAVLPILSRCLPEDRFKWPGTMLRRRVFHRGAYAFPAAVLYAAAGYFPAYEKIIQKASSVYLIVAFLFVLSAVLNSIQDVYGTLDIHKSKPIKGMIQLLKIIAFLLGAVAAVAVLTDQSPAILLTGIGAFSAVLLLIFRDSLLGLVAGIQLSADDMVRIGDSITMEKYNADGNVIDITLNTVKVENFDHTVTTIPAYAMISDSFINWRNIQQIQARRIKRAILIDMCSISFCTEDILQDLRGIVMTSEFAADETEKVFGPNPDRPEDTESGKLTNLGLFRIFLTNHIRNNPRLRADMPQIVRQLAPTASGLPLEIYAFTSETEWAAYEALQADLFDYIIAVAPRFGLRIFQNPAGNDVRSLRAE